MQEILDHASELAARFEEYDPREDDERDAGALRDLRQAVLRRAEADADVTDAVRIARKDGLSWSSIGAMLGTSGEAARQRYGSAFAKH